MKWVEPAEISGSITAPPSKSHMVRAAAAALLCKDDCLIENPSFCDDGAAALGIIESLGAELTRSEAGVNISGGLSRASAVLDCRESGLSIRLFSAIAAIAGGEITLKARGSLSRRPMDMIVQPLQSLGASCSSENGLAPIRIQGPIKGGMVTVDASESSQFLTGLLMALPLCDEDSTIRVDRLKSTPYLRVTLQMMNAFGLSVDCDEALSLFHVPGRQTYSRDSYRVVGDWSGVAFPAVAGAIAGQVTIEGLDPSDLQADRGVIEALRSAGAAVDIHGESMTVAKRPLKAFEFDATSCPDLFPSLVALAVNCEGVSKITGASRLIHKESNRADALIGEFTKLGAEIGQSGDALVITGSPILGGEADSWGDHRIAMALALAGIVSKRGVRISRPEAVDKSYPNFYKDLERLTESKL